MPTQALLANAEDANAWLDEDKVLFSTDGDAFLEARSATAVVKGSLYATFSNNTLVDTWDVNGTVMPPDIVRQITAMLMASYRYAKKYSEEAAAKDSYSCYLEQAAMALLQQILKGTIMIDATTQAGGSLSSTDFWPNDTTGALDPNTPWGAGSDRKFDVDQGNNRPTNQPSWPSEDT